ncbi:OmpA/MotB family protein [Desulfosoma caldarium]|uniref:Chemotaxis protein MotB n=1 Tax=Desulfosoma caldarium TaxID=610254 RepID=A0A3N1VJ03_9BACT|nr:flagellar motor protein MotB [Desulfosoma caldarium]ROR01900.1 chemotaxis protein MotB [Desulfosoma caldarium]
MAKKKKKTEDEGGGATWMVTFSDLSTLLLTFFVLLLSMSSLNEKAIRSTFQNFDKTSGILFFKEMQKIRKSPDMVIQDLIKSLKSVYIADVRRLDEVSKTPWKKDFKLVVSSGNALLVKKRWNPGDFSFIFGDQLLFESGSAELKPSAYPILDKFARFLNEASYTAYVDGHTDNVPINSPEFSSNEELALARGYAVLNYLSTHGQVPSTKLALAGYGETQPLAGNDTPEGRQLNRRVEIIFEKIK